MCPDRQGDSGRTIRLAERLAAASADEGFGPQRALALLREALDSGDDWLDREHQYRPEGRDWMLYPLFRAADRRCSMLVAVFRPGVRAPVHDHGSWAVIGIYRGRERETWYRRTDDRSVPGRAEIEELRSFVNVTGTVHVVPEGTIHTVEALDGADAVSIHVYGTDIVTQERSTFDQKAGTEEVYRPDFTAVDAAGR
jgi:predicted metal-dependent enzyme (double-stranded beta helix superfamily)